jgi:hypothetical protein
MSAPRYIGRLNNHDMPDRLEIVKKGILDLEGLQGWTGGLEDSRIISFH